MNKREKILIVDDDKIVQESLLHWFEEKGFLVNSAVDGDTALKIFNKDPHDLVLINLKMPEVNGLKLLKRIKEIDKDTIVIMITASASVQTAISALKEGANDYITKPIDLDEIEHLVIKALEQNALKIENRQLKGIFNEIIKQGNLISGSTQMNEVREKIQTISPTDTTVMIYGASGTGKELVAKIIHSNSTRKYFPFIPIKCSALTEEMLENDLFGEEAGSLNGNTIRKKGQFELVNGGTLYLDEVSSIPLKLQVELLRVLESKQFSRIGGDEIINTNFRLIVANNKSLDCLVKEGRFREDLNYKLNVFPICLPPLKERNEDILLLARAFVKKYSDAMNKPVKEFSKEAINFLLNYDWPGNVRELENAVERAIVIGKSDTISVEDLPFNITSPVLISDNGNMSLAAIEKKHIVRVLNENNWNISRSAQILEIDRVTLYNKINKYHLRTKV